MINEANEPSSACRLWRIPQVETSTPPHASADTIVSSGSKFKVQSWAFSIGYGDAPAGWM